MRLDDPLFKIIKHEMAQRSSVKDTLLAYKMSKKRSNRKCCVVHCENTPRYNPELQFYRFPGYSYELERKKQWIIAVNRQGKDRKLWEPGQNDRICSAHFVGGDKSNHPHNVSYNPTIFPTIDRKKPNLQAGLRAERLRVRKEKISSSIVNTAPILVGLNTVGKNFQNETDRKCCDKPVNPVTDPIETVKIENQHVPIETSHYNIKTEIEVEEDIFRTAGVVNIKKEENWVNMDTNCIDPWKVSGTSEDRKIPEIVQIIKDEPDWESNMNSALVDPLQIDEIHESDAIVKFEKVALPQ